MVKDWERCTALVDGKYSLSSVHTWHLDGRSGQKERRLVCHFCGAQPPTVHRTRLYEAAIAYEQEEVDQRKRQKLLRETMRGVRNQAR